jgi:class 3 adenylate cyclase/tetratricopeptide (TPR) repeat protein
MIRQSFLFFVFAVLFLCPVSVFGRLKGHEKIDSLLVELARQKEDTNKVIVLYNLSRGYSFFNPDTGLIYGFEGMRLAQTLKWTLGIARLNNVIGTNYQSKSDYPKALAYYKAAVHTHEVTGDKKGIADGTGNIGNIYYFLNDYPNALEYYKRSLKMSESAGEYKNVASCNINIGAVYFNLSDFSKALEYYFSALKAVEQIEGKGGLNIVTENIGNVYVEMGDHAKALEYYFKASKINEEIGDRTGVASIASNIGSIYQLQGNQELALEQFKNALAIYDTLGNKRGVAMNTCSIGRVYAKQKNYTMALSYFQQAKKIAVETGLKSQLASILEALGTVYLDIYRDTVLFSGVGSKAAQRGSIGQAEEKQGRKQYGVPLWSLPSNKGVLLSDAISFLEQGLALSTEAGEPGGMKTIYESLAAAYRLKGDYRKALNASDNFRAIKDSIFSKENNEKIVRMGMQHEYDRQRLSDSLKSDEKEKITALKLQRQRSYTYMGIAGIGLLLCFSFFIARERRKSEMERGKSDALLRNILPEEVANELKMTGSTAARHFDNVTVIFTDFVNFTSAAEQMSAQALIDELHTCFKRFDEITQKYNIEKIKTIGDAYLAVCGLPAADADHALKTVLAAREINAFMQDRRAKLGERTFEVRIGIHSGNVVAGIVGVKKFAYDIWGDTVNTAARIEQHGEPGKINISGATYDLVKGKFSCEYRGEIVAKNKGALKMYFVSE